MEVVMMHGSFDHQSFSPHKFHQKNPKKIDQNPIISNPSEAFRLSRFNSTGLLQPPPPPHRQSSQPPLLPLPTGAPRRTVSARGLAFSPANRKPSNPNSATSNKSKSPKKEGKNYSPKKSKDAAKVAPLISPVSIVDSGARKCEIGGGLRAAEVGDQADIFSSAAAFTFSPPPSSLPLPSFSLWPKLSCKAEAAAGVDSGATDDLRRLLRLQ